MSTKVCFSEPTAKKAPGASKNISNLSSSSQIISGEKCFLSREIINMKTEPKRCQEPGCNLILGWASKSSQARAVWKTALSGPAWWASSLCHCHLASAPARQTECHHLTGCSPPVPDRMRNKGRGDDRWCYTTDAVFVSEQEGGALSDVLMDMILRICQHVRWSHQRKQRRRQWAWKREPDIIRKQLKNLVWSNYLWLFIYINICLAVLHHNVTKFEKQTS